MKKQILSLMLILAMFVSVCPAVVADSPSKTVIEPTVDYSMSNTSGRPAWDSNGWLQVLTSAGTPSHKTHGIGIIGYDVSEIFETLSENPDYIVKSVTFKPYVGYYKSGASDLTMNMYVVNSDWRNAVSTNEYDKTFLRGYVADSGDVFTYPNFGTPDLSIETDIASTSNYSQKKVGSIYYRSAEQKEYDITNLFHIHKANNYGKENQNFFTFAFDFITKTGRNTEVHIPAMENESGLGGCYYYTTSGYADLTELAPVASIEVEYMKLAGLSEKDEPQIPTHPGDDLEISYNTPIESAKCSITEVATGNVHTLSEEININGADLAISYDFESMKSYVADINVSDIYGQALSKSYVITIDREVNDITLAMNTNSGNFHDAAFLTKGSSTVYSLNAAKNVYYEHGSNPNAFVMFKLPLEIPDEGSYVEKAVFSYTSDYQSSVASQRIFKFPGEDWHISLGDTTTVYDDSAVTAIMDDYETNKAGDCYSCETAGGYFHYLVDITEYVNECIAAGQSNIYLGVTAEKTTAKVYVRGNTRQDIIYTVAENPAIAFFGKTATIDGETLTDLSFNVLSPFEKDVLESAITLEDGNGNIVDDAVFEYSSGKVTLTSPVELASGESYKVIVKEGTEDNFGNSVSTENSVVYEFALNCDDASSKDILKVNYNSKESDVSVLFVSPYYQNHNVTVEIINTADNSVYYTKEVQTDSNGIVSLDGIEVYDNESYVVCVTPEYGIKSSADVLNSGYTSYLWDIAAFDTDASKILEHLDSLCENFGLEVGYKEYLSDFYDFCVKLAETRDDYEIGQQDAENLAKLKKVFDVVGLLTASDEISVQTNSEDVQVLYDGLMVNSENEELKERINKTKSEDKELFEKIYTDFIASEKSFDTIADFEVLIEKIYNENKLNIVLAMFKEINHISQTGDLLTDPDTIGVLGIGDLVEKYEKLKNKNIVHEAVYKKEFTSVDDFVKALEKAIDKAEEDEDSSGRSPSNKGGNSGVGASSNALALGVNSKLAEQPGELKIKFDDLSGYEWAKTQIEFLCQRGVINGKSTGVFDPSGNVLREEAIKMIVEAFELGATNTLIDFEDVPTDAWYADYVKTAKGFGITNGISPTLFGSGLSISRQDAAVMIYTALVKKGIIEDTGDSTLNFTDSERIAEYAKNAIAYMNTVGAITGYTDGSFKPDNTISRAEFAVVLGKICRLFNS